MIHPILRPLLGVLSVAAIPVTTYAAPVAFEVTGTISGITNTGDQQHVLSDATVGDVASFRVVYDPTFGEVTINQYFYGDLDGTNLIASVSLQSGDQSYEFVEGRDNVYNSIRQIDDRFSGVEDALFFIADSTGDAPAYSNGNFPPDRAIIALTYDVDTFGAYDDFGVRFEPLRTESSTSDFFVYGEDGSYTRISFNADSISLLDTPLSVIPPNIVDPPTAVPTPAAIGGFVLLLPLLLKRQHNN
ncbi:hypothetical protein KS4_13760 [Poriferisphaera corsica]|uniref:Uncharacterized protein n=2 Tax=Poriferisphaera corsica TaxID=2528020 RepID=A0A517YSX4_9BACT|nr:hypothetical protein KS4_13760 [Poriferisphaera corsica]